MLTVCMVLNVLAFVVIGVSPNLAILVIGVLLISIPGSLWHLPAIASLSRRFTDRRAFAISIHSFGSTVGNALGPIVAGLLLSLPPLEETSLFPICHPRGRRGFLRLVVAEGPGARRRRWDRIRGTTDNAFAGDDGTGSVQEPGYVGNARSRVLSGVLPTTRCSNGLPFFLESSMEEGGLGFSYAITGVLMGLLTGMGAVSSPILGQLSDKLGRKEVLVPGLAVASALPFAIVPAGEGVYLWLVMAGTWAVQLRATSGDACRDSGRGSSWH